MRSFVLSPAVMWLVVSLAAFPSWLVPLCAASGAGLLRPNTAPTLISANDTTAGAEKRRLHPPDVEYALTHTAGHVCSKDQFIPETGDCGGNPIPTIVINRGQIRIGVIEELPEGPFNADGVVAVASIGGDPVDQTGDDVMSVSVEVGDQDWLLPSSMGLRLSKSRVLMRRTMSTSWSRSTRARAALTASEYVFRAVECLEDEDCCDEGDPEECLEECNENFRCESFAEPGKRRRV
ncbi:unnamed protein product [Vitrella brassicaformis CCMP3155]|uniref:Uncharacterized protein n=1 Tax=Vitrella brassicaformis (strain CCMP3155) TaxID=1169540 RepID=A0A0G4FK21_VITBC|nr:unnamed protein product [Vitrella brassicaformis CCMP3155]|eukprot:CEM14059.1 unnamed protein product [Vitrella brassicaformis CCMP3155]